MPKAECRKRRGMPKPSLGMPKAECRMPEASGAKAPRAKASRECALSRGNPLLLLVTAMSCVLSNCREYCHELIRLIEMGGHNLVVGEVARAEEPQPHVRFSQFL